MSIIYEITNLINGKTYVGQHKTEDDDYLGSGSIIKQAVKKYGKENFIRTTLEKCNEENVNERECFWIAKRKSEGKAEYNISAGGYSNPFEYMTEEEKQAIYQKMSKTRKGKRSGSFGKTWEIGYCTNPHPEENNAKEKLGNPVVIMELNKHFLCYADCAEFIGVDVAGVKRCCYKQQKTVGGYHVCFEENYNESNNPYLNQPRGTISKNIGTKQVPSKEKLEAIRKFNTSVLGKPVRCIETGEVFKTIGEASKKLKVDKSSITAVCKGKQHSSKGYTFEYANKDIKYKKVEYPVIIMETEQIFSSFEDCAKEIDCSANNVKSCVDGRSKQCVGYHICYLKNYSKETNIWLGKERYSEPKQDYAKRQMTTKKRVICVETGEVFDSIAEAGRKTGCYRISECCNGKVKHASKGLHFKFVQ